MFALMQSKYDTTPEVINMNSPEYAALSMQGYVPIKTGFRKQLEEEIEELYSGENDLELNNEFN